MAKQKNELGTPRTPRGEGHGSESRLESLPMHLLVRVICHLRHNHLRNVSQVSPTLRHAVLLAEKFHFNYETPDPPRTNCITPGRSRVNMQRAGDWSDPLPRSSRNGWVDFTSNTPPPTRRGDVTPRRLDFSRLRMEE